MKIFRIILSVINGLTLIWMLFSLIKKQKKEDNILTFKTRNVNFKRIHIIAFVLVLISFIFIIIKKYIIAITLTIIAIILFVYLKLLKKEKIVIKDGYIIKYNLFGKEKEKYDIKTISKIEENNHFVLTIYFNNKKINLYYDLNSYKIIKSMVDNYNIEYIKNTL